MVKKPLLLIMSFLFVLIMVISGCGGGNKSSDTASDPATVIPAAPGTITVAVADSQLAASWEAVAGATLYKVYYSSKEDSTFAEEYAAVTVTSCVISGLANGTTYYIWVKAQNAAGTSDFSAMASGIPVAPVTKPYPPYAITLTPAATSIDASWEAVTGATSYEVWYGTSNNAGAAHKYGEDVIDSVCIISGLAEGTTYYVWLKSKNSAGTSDFSLVHSVTTAALGVITGLVNLNGSGNFNVTLVENQKTLSYTTSAYFSFTDLAPGTYHVRVDRSGYRPILKEVTLASNKVDLGTMEINAALPGAGFTAATVRADLANRTNTFRICNPQTITVKQLIVYPDDVRNYISGPGGTVWSAKDNSGTSPHSVSITASGVYTVYLVTKNHGYTAYIDVSYQAYIGYPQISLSKNWGNASGYDQVSISCSDEYAGLSAVQYQITHSMAQPSNWTTIPANTAVQFVDQGTWFLHVQCTNIVGNSQYVLAGPFIIH
jgi:hypothetical protein